MELSPTLHIIDYVIIAASLVISVAFGFLFSRRQKTTKNYFLAGGRIPAWAIGISIMATLISSVTFLAYPGEGYSSNWIRLVQGLMVPLVLISIIGFIVPLFRKVIKLSAYEYFERRFGFFARLYSSLAFLLTHFTKMGTVFFLLSLALSKMMGLDATLILWILGSSIIILTLVGGIEAVIWLDVIQGILLMAGGLICLAILIFTPEGGPAAVWKVAKENGHIGFGPFDWNFVNLTFWVMAINGVFYALQKYATDQTIVQRYLTAKSDKQAVKAALIGVLLSVPVWAMFMFIGTALFSYYKITGDPLPAGTNPDAIFPWFIVTKLPVGLVGLIISALLAAAISTLDSDLNSISAVCMDDYYVRLKPGMSEKHRVFVSKLFVLLAGLGAISIALLYIKTNTEGVLETVFTLYAIFSGGIAGIFLLGIFSKRANKQGLYIGIAACVIFTAWALLTSVAVGPERNQKILLDLGRCNFTQHNYMIGVYSHVIVFVVGYFASLFFRSEEPDDRLTFSGYLKIKRQNHLRNE
jgi:solute:Na+ symporter, SSS family